MIQPAELQALSARRGLYEVFEFNGVSADGRYAFLVRHACTMPRSRSPGVMEVAMMCFDRKLNRTACVVEREEMTGLHLKQLKRSAGWDDMGFSFGSGAFFEISPLWLRGKLYGDGGGGNWKLALQRRNEVLLPLPLDRLYAWSWNRHKVLIRDCAVRFEGVLQIGDMRLEGAFAGANLHYWGDGYPHEFATAQCAHFGQDADAYFYGLSTRVALGGLKSPYLGLAVLKVRGRRYEFNDLAGSFRHRLEALDNYRWRISFLSREFGLNVEIDGSNPRMMPWQAWHADHPRGGRSILKMTPFASGELTLYRRRNAEQVAVLQSDTIELKTLLPENLPEGGGFLARA